MTALSAKSADDSRTSGQATAVGRWTYRGSLNVAPRSRDSACEQFPQPQRGLEVPLLIVEAHDQRPLNRRLASRRCRPESIEQWFAHRSWNRRVRGEVEKLGVHRVFDGLLAVCCATLDRPDATPGSSRRPCLRRSSRPCRSRSNCAGSGQKPGYRSRKRACSPPKWSTIVSRGRAKFLKCDEPRHLERHRLAADAEPDDDEMCDGVGRLAPQQTAGLRCSRPSRASCSSTLKIWNETLRWPACDQPMRRQ